MDRSRQGERDAARDTRPPRASRLTVRPKSNRRKPAATPLWARLPKPAAIADACGRSLRRALPVLAALGVLVAISGTAWAGYRFVTHSPRFAIEQIELRGNHHLADDQARALLPIHVGDNVFEAGLDSIVRELRANPWVERADAHRVLPHTVVIEIHEHEPVALAELGGRYLVDASGHAFKRAEADDGDQLPLISGLDRTAYLADPEMTAKTITGALAALAEWRKGDRPSVDEVRIDPHGALAFRSGASTIELGAVGQDLGARLRTFDAAWRELSDDERTRARAIHLDTRNDHVTVAFTQKDQ
ncbi:MAG TPA: FtsQ-type POTRA domain-containing protein [Kofleriaceae bacterium]|jgi:cell division protein FtsQ